MHPVAIASWRRPVGRGPDEWVRELDAPTNPEQPSVHRCVDRTHVDIERLDGAMEEDRVTQWLRGRGEDKQLRLGGKQAEPLRVAVLNPAGHLEALGQPKPSSELRDT